MELNCKQGENLAWIAVFTVPLWLGPFLLYSIVKFVWKKLNELGPGSTY